MNTTILTEQYLKERLSKGIRDDGRNLLSFRKISLETGKIPHAEGSAEIRLGNTKILVGIKMDVGEPMKDKPDEGSIMTGAELLPMAHHSYDAGPPSPDAVELARVVDRGIRAGNIIDVKKLFIEEGKSWNVFIDLYVLNYDGNLFDSSALAAVAALYNSRMPKYEEGKVIREGNLERLPINNISTSCTYAKIGNSILLDTNASEEVFADARMTIANDEHFVRAMQKGLGGSFLPNEIDMLVDNTFEKSKELRGIIQKTRGD